MFHVLLNAIKVNENATELIKRGSKCVVACRNDDGLGDVAFSGPCEAVVSLRLCVSVGMSCFSPSHYLSSYLRSLACTVKVLIRTALDLQFLDYNFFKLSDGSLNHQTHVHIE